MSQQTVLLGLITRQTTLVFCFSVFFSFSQKHIFMVTDECFTLFSPENEKEFSITFCNFVLFVERNKVAE